MFPREILWTEEPGGLYSPWGHRESDRTEWLTLKIYIFKGVEIYSSVLLTLGVYDEHIFPLN